MGQSTSKDRRLAVILEGEIARVEAVKRNYPHLEWDDEVFVR